MTKITDCQTSTPLPTMEDIEKAKAAFPTSWIKDKKPPVENIQLERLPYILAVINKILLNTTTIPTGWICKIKNNFYLIEYNEIAAEYTIHKEIETGGYAEGRLVRDIIFVFRTKDFLRLALEIYCLKDTIRFIDEVYSLS